MENTTIVRGYIVRVEENTFEYCTKLFQKLLHSSQLVADIHLLKLETGVEISTLFVRIVGREGKAVNKRRRIAAATPKSKSFCLLIA
jgi:hypothetical protein